MSEQVLSHDDARELLAAYALGGLPAEESLELEALLRDWPEGRAELAQFIQVTDSLSASSPEEITPPIGLESRIIAAARGETEDHQERCARNRCSHHPGTPPEVGFARSFESIATLAELLLCCVCLRCVRARAYIHKAGRRFASPEGQASSERPPALLILLALFKPCQTP